MEQESSLFTKKALARLQSPEQLDTTLRLTSPLGWLALAFLFMVVALVTVWGFLGSIPVRVAGLGVVLQQGSEVFDLHAPAGGRVQVVDVRVGDRVGKGQRLVVLSLPELGAELAAARTNLEAVRAEQDRQKALSAKELGLRRKSVAAQVATLEEQIEAAQENLEYLLDRQATLRKELRQGYVTRGQVEKVREAIDQARLQIGEARDRIAGLRSDLLRFEATQALALLEMEARVLDAEAAVRKAEAALKVDKAVFSPVAGIVTEIDVVRGERVSAGQQVAVVEQGGTGLGTVAFLPLGKGKKVRPGMKAQVSPSGIERDLWGSIDARVVSVSDLPETRAGVQAVLGNETLAAQMLAGGAPLKAVIALEADPTTYSGLRWTSSTGPPTKVTPGDLAYVSVTVARKRPIDLVIPLFEPWILATRP